MRTRGLLLVVACVVAFLGGAASAAPDSGSALALKLSEAARLERRAFELYQANPQDPEIDGLIARSRELLQEVNELKGERRLFPGVAESYDSCFLASRAEGRTDGALYCLARALLLKVEDLETLENDAWKTARDKAKATEKTPVSPPKCTRALALAVPGCFKVDFWDVNIDRTAKRARCTFRGPAGEISVVRPLFRGTIQEKTCKLTNRTKVVDGVRKRVVRAELRITVPQGVTAAPKPKLVQVTVHWQ
jgi:hypothetical protein